MTNLRERLQDLDEMEAPEQWTHVLNRAATSSTSFPATGRRRRTWRTLAIVCLVAIAAMIVVTESGPNGDSAIAAAANAMSDPDLSFRYRAEGQFEDQTWQLEGSAIGQSRTHVVETTETKNGMVTRTERLIVEDREYHLRDGVWHRWPYNYRRPAGTSTEPICFDGSKDSGLVFKIPTWLEGCSKAWKESGQKVIDGVMTDKFVFGGGSQAVTAELWIGREDHLPRVLKYSSSMLDGIAASWEFFDFGEAISIEEPLEFEGPGGRGKSFSTGEKIVIAEGELSGRNWQVHAWTQEPLDGLCVSFSFGEGPSERGGGSGGACGAKPHTSVQGTELDDIGMVTTGGNHKIALLSKNVAKVRLEYQGGRQSQLVEVIQRAEFDMNFFVLVYEKGEGLPSIVALDQEGRELDRA